MKWLSHPLALIFFTILVGLIIISLRQKSGEVSLLTESVAQRQDELEVLIEEKLIYEEKVDLSNQPFQQELLARNELLRKKTNEIVVQIPIEKKEALINIKPEPTPKPWEQWWQILMLRD